MCHVMYIVVCFIILDVFKTISNENMNHKVLDTLSINDMTNALVNALGVNIEGTTDERIKELKEKLDKINSFAINKAKYEILLKNITAQTSLNETNFYKSLNEDDQFKFLSTKESKNLYLKLKERMNRDDIMKILAEKAEDGNVMRSARKVMTRGRNKLSRSSTDEELDVVVDEMLGEIPNDNHKYDSRDNQSVYWDPQIELEELRDYHRQGGRRLYRGERTTIRYYPFMVSIHVLDRFWCGGVIYWYDLVLTSAACLQLMHNNRFFRENPRVLQVRVGSNHSRISGEVVDALEVYFHPGYNPRTLRNNIAVIRLRRHLYLNYHRIPKLVAISHDANSIAATGEVLLLGWGVTKISQKLSYEPIYLQRKFLPVYPNTFCKEIYGE
ncbi:unnamed protein product [Chilo suppressalis]|uniref:Peptidase S1 domain-containing protein n=1 Tax=Chilo suppressalis TaxID=168631 RepID=A0ABN8L8Z2_CHISP|nr:unnamed protein product [Chilo suppressalis]